MMFKQNGVLQLFHMKNGQKKFTFALLLVVGVAAILMSWQIISWALYMLSSLNAPPSPYITESNVYNRIFSEAVIPLLSFILPLAVSALLYWKEKYKTSIGFTIAVGLITLFWYLSFSVRL